MIEKKRCFRIDIGNLGSEITIGRVTKEFVKYWENKDSNDLIEFLFNNDEFEKERAKVSQSNRNGQNLIIATNIPHQINKVDLINTSKNIDGILDVENMPDKIIFILKQNQVPNKILNKLYEKTDLNKSFSTLPKLDEEWENKQWYDVDDIEHVFGCNSDSIVTLTEVSLDSKIDLPDSTSLAINPFTVFGREAYHHNSLKYQQYVNDGKHIKDWIPILIVKTWEKDCVESWFIETGENGIDRKKLTISILETSLGEVIENIWYDKMKIERNLDVDSTRKGVSVEVGWMNLNWHDKESKYTDEYIENEGYWDDL